MNKYRYPVIDKSGAELGNLSCFAVNKSNLDPVSNILTLGLEFDRSYFQHAIVIAQGLEKAQSDQIKAV